MTSLRSCYRRHSHGSPLGPAGQAEKGKQLPGEPINPRVCGTVAETVLLQPVTTIMPSGSTVSLTHGPGLTFLADATPLHCTCPVHGPVERVGRHLESKVSKSNGPGHSYRTQDDDLDTARAAEKWSAC